MTVRSRSLSRAATAALAVTLAVTAAACGSSEDPQTTPTATTSTPAAGTSTTPTPTPTSAPEGTVVAIDIDDAEAGRREKIKVGEEVVLRVTATEAGTLHVHSSPEQELDFPAGTTDLTLVIDQPGIVDVEDHGTDTLLVQLEVS